MTLEHAISRRIEALQNCNSDRKLVSPTKQYTELRLPEQGTVAADVIDALCEGLTIEQFKAETFWSKYQVMENIYRAAKKAGVGIERRSERLHIVWPERSKNISSNESEAFKVELMSDLGAACAA